MNKAGLLVVLLLCALLGPYQSRAFGGDITLSISTSASAVDNTAGGTSTSRADIKIAITNRGNETASKVSLKARLLDITKTVSVADQLLPGKSVDVAFTIPVTTALHGSYPLFLNVLYEHSNGRSAAAASVAELRTVAAAHDPPLVLNLEQKRSGGGNSLTVRVSSKDPALRDVGLTCHVPADLTVEQGRQRIRLENGKGVATFNIAGAKGVQGRYAAYVVAEADVNGSHESTSSSVVVPVTEEKTLLDRLDRATWQRIGYGAVILTVLMGLFSVLSPRRNSDPEAGPRPRMIRLVDMAVLAACILFILANLNPRFLVTQTTTTGGDTASHYYTLDYLCHVLLPLGRVSGWTMGNYAGFPILQFYFPLPFLLMCLLSVAIPLQVAFKIVSLLGTLLLPVGAYVMLRCLRRPFPAPILGAIFTLPFLFHSANSMWGANILSTLAGEYSYSLSFSLSLILLGTLYYGARHDRWVIGNAVLVFLVGFSHGYTLLFVEAASIFFLITPEGFIRRLVYLFKVYALGFFLLAFWLVPLLVFTRFTTTYNAVWLINSWREVIPPQILPFAILAGIGSLVIPGWCAFKRPDNELLVAVVYLWFGLLVSVIFFIAAPKLGVADTRYIPYGQVLVGLLSAMFLGWLARFLPNKGPLWTVPVLCMLVIFLWVGNNPGPASVWAKWNYEGFEAKPAWPVFKEINEALKGGVGDPRVMYEHSEEHNVFGSSRAFESLPLFAGRATLEGLYMQASISAPFVFFLQSEISAAGSVPFPQYSYTTLNYARALPHLRLFNVGELVLRSDGAKRAIREVTGYRLKKTVGNYELWEVTANTGRYVEPLAFEPVLFPADHWKTDSYRWFMNEKQQGTHLVFAGDKHAGEDQRFKAKAGDLSSLPRIPIDISDCRIKETIGNDEIRIETNWIGKPLLVKVSYHPNWQVEGADRIYLVSPSFMLIYPSQTTVRLHYGRGWPDRAGAALTILGLVILALNLPLFGRERKTAWSLAADRLHLPPSLVPDLGVTLPARLRKRILVLVVLAGSLGVSWFCYHVYTSEANRMFNKAVYLKDAKRFEEARVAFRKVAAEQPFSNLSHDSAYFVAICYYLENKDTEAIAAFRKLISDYPESMRVPVAYYHIGLCQFRLGRKAEGAATMNLIVHDYPGTEWADHASDRLAEQGQTGAEPVSSQKANGDQAFSRAIAQFNMNRLQEARTAFEDFIASHREHPGMPQALACLAQIAYKQGECPGTIRRYRELISRYPASPLVPEAWYHVGLCEERLGRRHEAKKAMQTAAGYPAAAYGHLASDKLKGW
ncbi:MAG TPA: 6-pyruvoyl-tetrahydropterin synthase-related protein [Dongiaceae bacterium]|nr:6-pyruvoyl-tetrahydropterin synthase-related protein [Dongiaceae bacterium]